MKWLKRLFGGGLTYRGTAGSASVDSYQVQIANLYNELLFAGRSEMKPITVHQQWADFIEQALEWIADVGGTASDRPSFSVRDADVLRRLSDRVREKANNAVSGGAERRTLDGLVGSSELKGE